MINDYQKLSHSVWECKYHVVFIPKYRRKVLFGALRKELGIIFKDLARQKGCSIEEGHLMIDGFVRQGMKIDNARPFLC